jgi:hypothetical protein
MELEDIPCLPDEKDRELDELREDVADLSGNAAPTLEEKKDEKGKVVEETVTIGEKEVSKIITDPESGKETMETKLWVGGLKASYTYTGSKIEPEIHVYDGLTCLKKGTDYSVAYKNNIEIGKATVTVKGKGKYTGTAKATFAINPPKVKDLKLKAGKKQLTAKWKKAGGVDGYEIEYSLKKDFSKSKKVEVKGVKTLTTELKNLKQGKVYYIRIRTYKTVGGKKYYSEWSDVTKQRMKGTAANDGEEEDSEFRSPHN